MTILVVDDEPFVLKMFMRVVADHTVLTASSFSAALRALEAHDIDVVISDYQLRSSETGLDVLANVAQCQPDAARVLHVRRRRA